MATLSEFFSTNVWPGAPAWLFPALLMLFALVVLYVGFRSISGVRHRRHRAQHARLSIVDVEEVDGRRRLVLLRRDGVEHLIMIGGPSDIVIESGIGSRVAVANAPRGDARSGPLKPDDVPAPKPAASAPPAVARALQPVAATQEPAAMAPSISPPTPPKATASETPAPRREPTLTSSQTSSSKGGFPASAKKAPTEHSEKLDGEIQELLAQMGRDSGRSPKLD